MLLHTDVGKDRFHDPQPPGINFLASFAIDLGLHRVDLFIPAHIQAVERVIVWIGSELLALKTGFIFSDGGDVFFAPSSIGAGFS